MISKRFVTIFVLCLVQGCLSKPAAESDLTGGRWIGSTLWGWLTYPISWWSSETEPPPINDQLIASTSKYVTLESIEIAKHNVTVWCNDQTCTTQKCDRFGCGNLTCNIYDTDLLGECRVYNTISKPEEHVPNQPTKPLPKPSFQNEVTEATKGPKSTSTVAILSSTQKDASIVEKYNMELDTISTTEEPVPMPTEPLPKPSFQAKVSENTNAEQKV